MTASNIVDFVEDIVESANDRGVKVGGEWRNVSRFHPRRAASAAASTRTTRDREIRRKAVLKAVPTFLG